MTTTKDWWLSAVLLPPFLFVSATMCLWPYPSFLGIVALFLLFAFSLSLLFALIPPFFAFIYYLITSFIYWRADGEFPRRISKALACGCFLVLTILAFRSALSLRHQAFVRASRVGDGIAQALAQYRRDKGDYPEELNRLVPQYLQQIPSTQMIGYPDWIYSKGRNDLDRKPDTYELRINCSTGVLDFDWFIYWPSEDYPERIRGNGVERIRTWAYIHE